MSEIIKEEQVKKTMPKWAKKLIAALLIVSIIVAGVFVIAHFFGNQIKARVIFAVVPHSIQVADENGVEYECIIELNPDYKPDREKGREDLGNAFRYYRIDKDGTKTDMGVNPSVSYNEAVVSPFLQFILAAINNGTVGRIKTTVTTIAVIVALVVVCVIIYLWYRSWCKRQDMEKEHLYGNKNKQKHKKKN